MDFRAPAGIRIASGLVLLSASGLLAGCNASGGLSSRGPWGPADGRRSYPPYSAPWGNPGRNTGIDTLQVEPGYSGHALAAGGPGPSNTPLAYRFGAGLPADPHQPTAPAAPGIRRDAPIVSEEIHPRETPAQPVAPPSSPAVSPPGVFAAPRRASSYAGSWKATDGKGTSCMVHLSSVASLDLYKASISRCSGDELRDVNLWKFDGNRVALYSRGAEVAHLEGSEALLSGALSKSGITLKMVR